MAVFFTSDTHFGDHRTLNIPKAPVRIGGRDGRGVGRRMECRDEARRRGLAPRLAELAAP